MPDVGVRFVGLRELRSALRAVDKSWGPELGKANFEAASVVAGEAQRRAPSGPHQGGGTVAPIASTIRALRAQNAAKVSMGGARSPHAVPTEFGGTLPRHASSSRTRVAKRPFLFPAIRSKTTEVIYRYQRLVDALVGRAFK